jgi:hypothetical protein
MLLDAATVKQRLGAGKRLTWLSFAALRRNQDAVVWKATGV